MMLRRHARAFEQLAIVQDARVRAMRDAAAAAAVAGEGTTDAAVSTADEPDGHLLIVDLDGGTVKRFLGAWKLWSELARVAADYYPEMLGMAVIIRAPPIAKWGLDLCKKNFIDARTATKIQVCHESTRASAIAYVTFGARVPHLMCRCFA